MLYEEAVVRRILHISRLAEVVVVESVLQSSLSCDDSSCIAALTVAEEELISGLINALKSSLSGIVGGIEHILHLDELSFHSLSSLDGFFHSSVESLQAIDRSLQFL